jgi:hypothetical protein
MPVRYVMLSISLRLFMVRMIAETRRAKRLTVSVMFPNATSKFSHATS